MILYWGNRSGAVLKLDQAKLKDLRLTTNVCDEEHMYLIPFLKASPCLETLAFPVFKRSKAALIVQTINQCCQKLRDIYFSRNYDLEDNDIAEFKDASRLSGLRKFSAHPKVSMGPKSATTLCNYTTTLESVRISAVGPE
ncbi:hypothetical protein BGX20_007683, partial [Mortierella sp. AD010]